MGAVAPGVLPDAVSRDPKAESWLVFVDLPSGADVQTWLRDIATPAADAISSHAPVLGEGAVYTVGFGPTLFQKANFSGQQPAGLSETLPAEVPADPHDVFFYIFSLSDAVVADFLRAVSGHGETVTIERGYQRSNRREVFGQRDGLRNVVPVSDRAAVSFVSDSDAQEPAWCHGGSYMAYLKIRQDVAAWKALGGDAQQAVVGRRVDGSRADLPAGTIPSEEGAFTDGTNPPLNAHVRKAGPRGANEDSVRIFRRGTPFVECESGIVVEGLHFVSYQSNVDNLLTILERWMLNANFPQAGAQRDALFAAQNPLATFMKGGLYFAVPADDRFIGAGLFDPPASQNRGVLQIRLTVVDSSNQPDRTASLEGATFEVRSADSAVLATAITNAAGRVSVPNLSTDVPLDVVQTGAPQGSAISNPANQSITLSPCLPGLLNFVDSRTGTPGGYA